MLLKQFRLPLAFAGAFSLFAALAALALPASAQDTIQDGIDDGTLEEVIVTGSRIARDPNLTNVSPVVSVASEEFVYAGVARTEDLLNDLPSIYAAQEAGQANGATGTATINLRSLGTDRTLVLVNGRRLPPGTPIQGGFAPDINQVPTALIERVDVLTGGSSATYGSDAVSGVVNFITVRDFEGFRVDMQGSTYRHTNEDSASQRLLNDRRQALQAANDPSAEGYETPNKNVTDGEIGTFSLLFGTNTGDDRGNLTGYFTYREVEPVLQAQRDYSRCDFWGGPDGFVCGGSGTIPNGRFTNFGALSGGTRVIPMPANGMCPPNSTPISGPTDPLNKADSLMPEQSRAYCRMHGAKDEGGAFLYDFIPGVGDQAGTFQQRPGDLVYNYAPTNFFQRPDENYSAGLFFHYDITDTVEVYSEFNYADNHTQAQIAFSGSFFEQVNLSCGNPLMSEAQYQSICGQLGLSKDQRIGELTLYNYMAAVKADPEKMIDAKDAGLVLEPKETPQLNEDGSVKVDPNTGAILMMPVVVTGQTVMVPSSTPASLFIGKRNVEGGPRSDDLRHTSRRFVLGFRGELPNGWNWDIYGLLSEVSLEETYMNDLSVTRINRALDVVADEDGNPVCRTAQSGQDSACVPWNLFRGQGLVPGNDVTQGITQSALDYLRLPLFRRGTTEQDVISGYVSGDLGQYGIRVPSAEEGLSAALGFEYRRVALESNPDQGFQSGEGSGQGGATQSVDGEYDVEELFGEVVVPLAQGLPGAEDLFLETAYRYSSYSIGHETHTYKLGLSWTPISDITLRATTQRAVRAPHIYELFLAQGNNLTNIEDPCSADTLTATAEQCARTGLSQTLYDAGGAPTSPAGQYNFLQGGNPNLEPEESDTLSFGIILQPSFLPGFDMSVDYFNIEVEKAVASISSQTILDKCLDGSTPALCQYINRNPSDGNLWLGTDDSDPNYGYIEGLQTNIGFLATEGVDIKANYEFGLPEDMGSLRLANTATHIISWEQEEFDGAGIEECAGRWSGGCGDPTFKLQNNFRVTWFTPWTVAATLSWRYISEADSLNVDHVDLDAMHYFDLAAVWDVPFVDTETTVRFGVNNLLDEDPPLYGHGSETFGNGNTFPGYYDALGQYWFLGMSINFE